MAANIKKRSLKRVLNDNKATAVPRSSIHITGGLQLHGYVNSHFTLMLTSVSPAASAQL